MNRTEYDDIINLPHHVSKTRPQMSMADRAAQFSPYAALTGFDAAIAETGRLTEKRSEPDEDTLAMLNLKFRILEGNLESRPQVAILYFVPDEQKDGGTCIRVSGVIEKIDTCRRTVTMQDGTRIPLDDILDFEGEVLKSL